jgi:hypothetical protein
LLPPSRLNISRLELETIERCTSKSSPTIGSWTTNGAAGFIYANHRARIYGIPIKFRK